MSNDIIPALSVAGLQATPTGPQKRSYKKAGPWIDEFPSFSELSWLAGLLEGEGSFLGPKPHRSGRNDLRIKCMMSDEDVVARCFELLGGSLNSRQPNACGLVVGHARKMVYTATLTGRRAASAMMALYPLMGDRRRRQISEAIKQWET